MDKLRILCLHGYHGSGDILRGQMAPLVDGMEAIAECVYLDAPSLAFGDFGWWHARTTADPPTSKDAGVGPIQKRYVGWERTIACLVETLTAREPFDGVFGFSQGASLTSLLVGLRSPDGCPTEARPLTFDFAVMVGGFLSADPTLALQYADRHCYDLPSAHVIGLGDRIVPATLSRALAAVFKEPLVLEHDGGHVVAATPTTRSAIRGFLEAMLRRKTARLDTGSPSQER